MQIVQQTSEGVSVRLDSGGGKGKGLFTAQVCQQARLNSAQILQLIIMWPHMHAEYGNGADCPARDPLGGRPACSKQALCSCM